MSVGRMVNELGSSWGRLTDAEAEEEKQRYGVGAQAPVQVALLWSLGLSFHWEGWVKE